MNKNTEYEIKDGLLEALNQAIDAMRVTQRLFGLENGHILMSACKNLEQQADLLRYKAKE
jgi:hypothetical protein